MRAICDDLDAETQALSDVVAGLTEDEWRLPTPAAGWDTHETIIHLGTADVAASMAVLDPDAFLALKERTGLSTFPQIFLDGNLLGGYQDLAAFQASGKLKDLL